jgi:methionyl-tRNA formyltransferase
MRVVFIGTVQFSLKVLEKLLSIKANIVGVCTKKESFFNSDFADLVPLCENNEIPYIQTEDINSNNNIKWIKDLKPDIIFCFGWSSLINEELLMLPPMGIIGYHPSKLPMNRGRHPLIWALVLGLKESASTFFFMRKGVDDGDILSQEIFKIEYEDDAMSIYNKVINIALIQIEKFLPQLEQNKYLRTKQNHTISNTWRKRNIIDGQIDFKMNSYSIYNLVRALSKPYIGAHINYKNQHISIWKVEEVVFNQSNIEYGKIIEIENNTILIKTYDGAIKILQHEFLTLPKVGEYL